MMRKIIYRFSFGAISCISSLATSMTNRRIRSTSGRSSSSISCLEKPSALALSRISWNTVSLDERGGPTLLLCRHRADQQRNATGTGARPITPGAGYWLFQLCWILFWPGRKRFQN